MNFNKPKAKTEASVDRDKLRDRLTTEARRYESFLAAADEIRRTVFEPLTLEPESFLGKENVRNRGRRAARA